MDKENNVVGQYGAWIVFILSGAILFAGVGPASVEFNRAIGVVASMVSFVVGYVQARNISSTCLLSFVVSASGLVVAFTQL
jgi:hypothetical protein